MKVESFVEEIRSLGIETIAFGITTTLLLSECRRMWISPFCSGK